MTRTIAVFGLALAGLLGGSSPAHAFRIRLVCVRPVVSRPVVPCGLGLFGCRIPALVHFCREVVAAPPVLVAPAPPPPLIVPPMPPAPPVSASPSGPIVSVPGTPLPAADAPPAPT